MQSFLGAADFFHTHTPNFASWASALYECTVSGFNWDPSTWKTDYKKLFELFKTAITRSVTLHFPDYTLPWVVRSDSSDHAVGAVFFQEFTDSNKAIIHQPIAFAFHKYSGAAINWDTFKQEAYALYFSIIQFGYYLCGKPFLLETDDRNFVWMSFAGVSSSRAIFSKFDTFQEKTIRWLTGSHACTLYILHHPLSLQSQLLSP